MKPLHVKLQGLWVGAALGELYGTERLNATAGQDLDLVPRLTLRQTERLLALAAHWIKTPTPQTQDVLQSCDRLSDVLLALLPLIFLHPGSVAGLSESLLHHLGRAGTAQRDWFASAMIVVQSVAQLQQTETLVDFIPHLLQTPALQTTAIPASLQTAQRWLADYCGASDLLEANLGNDLAIAQVLYLVLSTPEDFRLTVQRAGLLWAAQPEWVMLVAALSGFHNGIKSLPLEWRLGLRQVAWQGETAALEDGLLTLAHLCAARWAGSYTVPSPKGWSTVAIAPPGQLRPR
ncbi:MAG: hypothetical protein WCD18_26280 [Thermosynechococcaceae cyanobacterium]